MNRILLILTFTLTLVACSNKTDIEGYWRLSFGEESEDYFIPYELSFKQDSLLVVDGYNFKQISNYSVFGDSITITFANGVSENYSFFTLNDSTINFADREYFRTSKEYFSKTQSYELLGWQSEKIFKPKTNSTRIHLIKDNNSTKVILNDITTDLKYLPEFLSWGHGQKPTIYLYLGKGIDLIDLLDAYCWFKYSGYLKVELVTSNISFEKFYSLQDYVNVDDSAFLKFLDKNSLPPPPPLPESNDEIIDVFIDTVAAFNYEEQSDTGKYRYNFSTQLDINQYLELTEKLNKKENKKLKRLTTLYKMH